MGFAIEPSWIERVLTLAVEVQQIPAPTFAEHSRAAFVLRQFQQAGLKQVSTDPLGNVFARLAGGPGRAVLLSAHLDTVFGADTDLTVSFKDGRIFGPGIGDNALAVAALVGLVWVLDALNIRLPGDLWLAANVGEEGLGDLKGMRAVVEKLGDRVAATIVLEGLGFGSVVHQGIGSRRYRVSVEAPGGHSWGDFGKTSAIHTLVQLAERLTRLNVPVVPKTTFNIGVIEGGTSVNSIAPRASLQLDLRSESAVELNALVKQVEAMVKGFAVAESTLSLEVIGDRPSGRIERDHWLVKLAAQALSEHGVDAIDFRPASTDANVPLSLGQPAVCVGLTRGGNPHRLSEYIETRPFYGGFGQLLDLTVATSQRAQKC